MKEKKGLTILGFILIGIVLLPIAACLLYVILGAGLLITLMIIDRVKNGRSDPKEGKNYKTASGILFLAGLIAFVLIYGKEISFLDWKVWLGLQIVTFIGLLPLVVYTIKKLKHKV